MNVLAFDACLGAVSVAARWQAADGQWFVREAYEEMRIGHAERLLPMVDDVMQSAGLAFADVGRIAVTRGPGSFTGVRVTVAAARGLALAAGVPTVATTSLRVMALRAADLLRERPQAVIATAVNAGRSGLYVQLFEADTCAELSAAEVLSPVEAARRVAAHGAIVVGSGGDALASAAGDGLSPIEALLPNLQPHAAYLALLASTLPPVQPVTPLYLRPPDAKPQPDAALPRAD